MQTIHDREVAKQKEAIKLQQQQQADLKNKKTKPSSPIATRTAALSSPPTQPPKPLLDSQPTHDPEDDTAVDLQVGTVRSLSCDH